MCNWNTYTFDCGCLEVRLRDRCSANLVNDEADTCSGMQRVRREWWYSQPRGSLCAACRGAENGEPAPKDKAPTNGEGRAWADIDARAHAEALRKAAERKR